MPLNIEDRPGDALRGVAEPLLAVVAVFLLTGLLALPFAPVILRVEVELRPAPAAESLATHAELLERIESLGLVDSAEVLLLDGASRLVLQRVSDVAQIEGPVGDVLVLSGYRRDELVTMPELDMEGLLHSQPHAFPLLLSIQAAILLGSGLLLARGRIRRTPPEALTALPHSVRLGLAAGVGALALSAVISMLLTLVGLPVEEQDWVRELFAEPLALLRIVPFVVLIGPIAEEIFFRWYFFRFTSQRVGLPAGMLLSSVVFALIHWNASGFLIYLGIGCILAWVYHRTGRILAPIIGHVTLNAIVLIVSVLTVEAT